MRRASLVLLVAIQVFVFLGTLGLGIAGALSGEAAGCVAIVAWFVVGLPGSYAAADSLNVQLARRDAASREALSPVQSPGSAA